MLFILSMFLYLLFLHFFQCPVRSTTRVFSNTLYGGVLSSGGVWVNFAGYVSLASQSLHPIIIYSVVNYTLHLSQFWANM